MDTSALKEFEKDREFLKTSINILENHWEEGGWEIEQFKKFITFATNEARFTNRLCGEVNGIIANLFKSEIKDIEHHTFKLIEKDN